MQMYGLRRGLPGRLVLRGREHTGHPSGRAHRLEYPAGTIIPDSAPEAENWLAHYRNYASQWPNNISRKATPPPMPITGRICWMISHALSGKAGRIELDHHARNRHTAGANPLGRHPERRLLYCDTPKVSGGEPHPCRSPGGRTRHISVLSGIEWPLTALLRAIDTSRKGEMWRLSLSHCRNSRSAVRLAAPRGRSARRCDHCRRELPPSHTHRIYGILEGVETLALPAFISPSAKRCGSARGLTGFAST